MIFVQQNRLANFRIAQFATLDFDLNIYHVNSVTEFTIYTTMTYE